MPTDAAAPAPGPTPPALAATPRARVFVLRCRRCHAFVERGDALCAAGSEPVPAPNAVEDRRKRRAYRAHHGMARASMPDDAAVAHMRPGAYGLQDAEAHARAVHADVDALADKAIGHATRASAKTTTSSSTRTSASLHSAATGSSTMNSRARESRTCPRRTSRASFHRSSARPRSTSSR